MSEYICNLCPRNCGAVRTKTTNNHGFCGMPYGIFAAKSQLHYWEEPCISGENGSGTVFFSGCQLKCCFCQNNKLSHNNYGKEVEPQQLAHIFRTLKESGANNINLVSATPYLPLIKNALQIYHPEIPVVFNSGGYEKPETLREYSDIIDVFLLDFKFISSEKSLKYAKAENYPQTAKQAILTACDIAGENIFNSNGIMQKGVIIRHLLLPKSTNDAIAVIDWVKQNAPGALFSLMAQYTVMGEMPFPELNRKITLREYQKVLFHFQNSGLDGYVQDLESSSSSYIPNFDFSGL